MVELKTKKELEEILNNSNDNVLSIVKFHAKWCSPCKQLGLVISKIKNDYTDVKFYGVNVDDDVDELVEEYHVMSIPVLLFFKGGLQVDKTVGSLSEVQLKEKIKENLNK